MKKFPPIDTITKIVHELIDQHCGRDGPSNQEYVPKYWPDEENFNQFREIVNQLIASSVASKHGQPVEFNDAIVPEEAREVITEAIELRRGEIRVGLINRIISSSTTSIAMLKDFDWQVKMVLASNVLSEINESLVNLDLLLLKPSSEASSSSSSSSPSSKANRDQIVSLEMDKSELRKLIDALEDLSTQLDE